jgi:flavodoxin
MGKIKIIFGSCGGNTAIVAERVTSFMEKKGLDVSLLNAKTTSPEEMTDCELLILASPTYGHGLLEGYMQKFITKAKDVDLNGIKAAAIGLGDDKYDSDYFIEAAKILHRFLNARGANVLVPPLQIANCPLPQLDEKVLDWTKRLLSRAK